MASEKRNFSDFSDFGGKFNLDKHYYEFPTLYSYDSKERVRRWSIQCRLIKPNGKKAYGQNWNLLEDNQLRIDASFLNKGMRLTDCECQLWIEQGILDGQNSRSPPVYAEITNLGRANERNVLQQALTIMRSKYLKRLEEGAKTNIKELDISASDDNSTYYWPMLATKFKEEFAEIKYPAYAQIKMNGVRMLSYITSDGEVITHTRDLKDIVGIPQIRSELSEPLLTLYNEIVSKSMRIDGELFGFDVNLNEISGWARNPAINNGPIKVESRNLFEEKKIIELPIQYFIFDCFDPDNLKTIFQDRLHKIEQMRRSTEATEVRKFPIDVAGARKMAEIEYKKAYTYFQSKVGKIETHAKRSEEQEFLKDEYPFGSFHEWLCVINEMDNCTEHKTFDFEIHGNLAFVPTLEVKTKAELLCLYYAAVIQKFEGLMVRNEHGVYATSNESKTSKNRSADLQKLKPWYDEEFEIVGYTSGKGRNHGAIIWICKTVNGHEFNCDPKNMTIEDRKKLYAEFINSADKFKNEYKGLMMTIQYEEKNNDSGIPQRAKALGIRTIS